VQVPQWNDLYTNFMAKTRVSFSCNRKIKLVIYCAVNKWQTGVTTWEMIHRQLSEVPLV